MSDRWDGEKKEFQDRSKECHVAMEIDRQCAVNDAAAVQRKNESLKHFRDENKKARYMLTLYKIILYKMPVLLRELL